MKVIIAVTSLAFFIQTFSFWGFEALGQSTDECAQFSNASGCCGTGKCVFVACHLQPNAATGIQHCVSNISAAGCNETSPVDLCQTRLQNCSNYNATDCCSKTGCELYNCTDEKSPVDAGLVCGENSTAVLACPSNRNGSATCSNRSNDITTAAMNTTETTTSTPTTQTTTPAAVTTATTEVENGTVPTSGNVTQATTTKAETSSVTARTESTSAGSGNPSSAPTSDGDSGRHFDAASFIGGIVLTLGLVVIIFIGLKFYRSRSQQNYRTL